MAWWETAGSSLSVSGVNTLHGLTSLHFCVLDFSSRLSYFGQRHAPCLGESEGFAVRTFLCSGWLQLDIWSWCYVKLRSISSDYLTTSIVSHLTIMLKNIWWHWSHRREPEVEEDPWQKGCPSNIICPPKPPNVVIPNIRFEDITNLVTHGLLLIRNILYIRASDIRTASNIAKKNIVARQRLQVNFS